LSNHYYKTAIANNYNIKVKMAAIKLSIKNAINIFIGLKHGYTACKNIMQKKDGIIKLIEFPEKVHFEQPARHKDSQRTMPDRHPCANVSVYQFEEVVAPIRAGFLYQRSY
jgi:hypothetical protein